MKHYARFETDAASDEFVARITSQGFTIDLIGQDCLAIEVVYHATKPDPRKGTP